MLEGHEGGSGAVFIDEKTIAFVARFGVGLEEIGECLRPAGACPLVAPVDQIAKIHIGREVAMAGVAVNFRAFHQLLKMVATERAGRAAVVNFFGAVAVIDREHATGFPQRHPLGHPVLVGFVDFDPLADGVGLVK